MTKKGFYIFFARFARKKGERVVQISGLARNLNHFPLFSREQSEREKPLSFLSCTKKRFIDVRQFLSEAVAPK